MTVSFQISAVYLDTIITYKLLIYIQVNPLQVQVGMHDFMQRYKTPTIIIHTLSNTLELTLFLPIIYIYDLV